MTTRFADATIADVKQMLGTILPGAQNYIHPELTRTQFKYDDTVIPESFDVRTNWPECASITGHVRDQSSCGSCWAFGSTEAFNDRYCIATGHAVSLLSVEDTLSCCTGVLCGLSQGCNGGQPSGAWRWFVRKGVSTGGDNVDKGSGTTCKPYSLQSCAHHVDPPPGLVACDTLPDYKTPECTNTCTEQKYETDYKQDKHFATSSYSINTVENLQKELMERGTISVSMSVYEDFESYSSGVYQHVSGRFLGGHAIKLIGWGVEYVESIDDSSEKVAVPYWICVNSWNDHWGEGGTFRILRGKDECGIESGAVAGEVTSSSPGVI